MVTPNGALFSSRDEGVAPTLCDGASQLRVAPTASFRLKTYSVGKIPSSHDAIRCPMLFTQPRDRLARWRVLFLPTMQKPHYQSDSEPNQEDGTARE
jgi:hypothetical protein